MKAKTKVTSKRIYDMTAEDRKAFLRCWNNVDMQDDCFLFFAPKTQSEKTWMEENIPFDTLHFVKMLGVTYLVATTPGSYPSLEKFYTTQTPFVVPMTMRLRWKV